MQNIRHKPWRTSAQFSCLLLCCFCCTLHCTLPEMERLSAVLVYNRIETLQYNCLPFQRLSTNGMRPSTSVRLVCGDGWQLHVAWDYNFSSSEAVSAEGTALVETDVWEALTCQVMEICPPEYASMPTRCSPFSIFSPVALQVLRADLATSRLTILRASSASAMLQYELISHLVFLIKMRGDGDASLKDDRCLTGDDAVSVKTISCPLVPRKF